MRSGAFQCPTHSSQHEIVGEVWDKSAVRGRNRQEGDGGMIQEGDTRAATIYLTDCKHICALY